MLSTFQSPLVVEPLGPGPISKGLVFRLMRTDRARSCPIPSEGPTPWRRAITALIASAVAFFLTAISLPIGAFAAEDCEILSAIPDCPPQRIANPVPQDCSTCTSGYDDDADCVIDEEILNGLDDDGDTSIDEDISCLNTCDPLNYDCRGTPVEQVNLLVPQPFESSVTLPARIQKYGCLPSGNVEEDFLITIEPDVDRPNPACGVYIVQIHIKDALNTTTYFKGPAALVHTRRYETFEKTLLSPTATGNVAVYRYALRADLKPVVPYANLPAILKIPCVGGALGFKHVFFYGHTDVAVDTADSTNRRYALGFHHAPSQMSHPPASSDQSCFPPDDDTLSPRHIDNPTDARAHATNGWFVVAPGDTFNFTTVATVPAGDYRYGRIRTVTMTTACEKPTRMCVSQFENPQNLCDGHIVYEHVRFCGQATGCLDHAISSDRKCSTTPPGDTVAFFRLGYWSDTLFPYNMELSMMEGALSCDNFPPPVPSEPDLRPYWYGSYTHQVNDPPPPPSTWFGPPDALDVVNNKRIFENGSYRWLVGAVHWENEGTPSEIFVPAQDRAMYFFADQNPLIPEEPCSVHAVITPPSTLPCPVTSEPLTLCLGDVLHLSGECSTMVNCCQCGELEYRWLRCDPVCHEVRGWLNVATYDESPGPSVDTDYRLEVRCSTSRNVCIDYAQVKVSVAPKPTASPTAAPPEICLGEPSTIDAGASGCGPSGCTCSWSAAPPPNPPDGCNQVVYPTQTTTYTVTVTDISSGCKSDAASVVVKIGPSLNPTLPCPPQICYTLSFAQMVGDDDGDGSVNEELPDGIDNDNDGCFDEDIDCTVCNDGLNFRGCSGAIPDLDVPPLATTGQCGGPVGTLFRWDATAGTVTQEAHGRAWLTDLVSTPCGSYTGTIWFDGDISNMSFDAELTYDRNWQVNNPELVPGALAQICVDRYMVKADLREYVHNYGPPWIMPPCFASAGRVFFYGHLDRARACDDASKYLISLALTHSMGEMSHPECSDSQRPLTVGDPARHPGVGWSLIAPNGGLIGCPSLPFTFDFLLLPPNGTNITEDTVRQRGSTACRPEYPLMEANVGCTPDPTWLNVKWSNFSADVRTESCTCENYASVAACEIPSASLATISLGRWIGNIFPANQSVHAVEGAVDATPTSGSSVSYYVYGSATRNAPNAYGYPTGPENLIDIITNGPAPADRWIGAPSSWHRVHGIFNPYLPYLPFCP